MKLVDCGRSLVRNAWLILLVAVAAGGVAYVVAAGGAVQYESSGRLVLGLGPELAAPQNGQALNNISNRQLIATFAEVAGSAVVRDEALASAAITSDASSYTLTAARLPEANGIEVLVLGPSAKKAQLMAEKAMASGSAKFLDLYPDYVATPVQQPQVPTARVAPRPKVMALVAGMLGLIIGFLLGLLLDAARARRHHAHATDEPQPLDA